MIKNERKIISLYRVLKICNTLLQKKTYLNNRIFLVNKTHSQRNVWNAKKKWVGLTPYVQ